MIAKGIRSLVVFLLAFMWMSSTAYAYVVEDELPQIKAVVHSYDYREGPGADWGFSYSAMDYRNPPQYVKPVDFAYGDLSQEDVISLLEHPEDWRKYWVRLDITPAWEPQYSMDIHEFVGELYRTDVMIDKDMFVRNVEVPIFIPMYYYDRLPLVHARPYMLVSGVDYFMEDLSKYYEREWGGSVNSEGCSSDSRQWIAEMLCYVGGMDEQEIADVISSTTLSFDVLLFHKGKLYAQNIEVGLEGVPRDTHYGEDGVRPLGKTYTQFFPDLSSMAESEIALLAQIPEDVLKDAMAHPERYAWYDLDAVFQKDMPWGVCSVRILPKTDSKDYWVFHRAEMDGDLYWSNSDAWENGENPIGQVGILVKLDDGTDLTMQERMREMEFVMEFSTEWAGRIYWGTDEAERIGYPGPRFLEDVDMSQVQECAADSGAD